MPPLDVIRWRETYPDAGSLENGFQPLPRHILADPFSRLDAEAFIALPFWTSDYVGLGPPRGRQPEIVRRVVKATIEPCEHAVVQRSDDLIEGAAGKIGAPDTTGEERVPGDQLLLRREVEAHASLRVSRRVHRNRTNRAALDGIEHLVLPGARGIEDYGGEFRDGA